MSIYQLALAVFLFKQAGEQAHIYTHTVLSIDTLFHTCGVIIPSLHLHTAQVSVFYILQTGKQWLLLFHVISQSNGILNKTDYFSFTNAFTCKKNMHYV